MASSSSLEQFVAGESLSTKYMTEEQHFLGRGKFSAVHCTRRRSDQFPVALKKIQIFEMGSNERHECMNEIKLLQSMRHTHIINYLDCIMENNELTVVMELAEHGDIQLHHSAFHCTPRRCPILHS